MTRISRLLTGGFLALTLAGCNSDVVYVPADGTVLTPKPSAYDIQVEYGDLKRPYRVLGEVRVTRDITANLGSTGAFDHAVDKLKERARRVGGDAVTNLKALDSQKGGTAGRLTLVGTVVVFTAPISGGAPSR